MTLEKLMSEARHGETSRDMDYRYNILLSFGEDILADKISLTEKELIKYLDEYERYLWDTEKYGGYDDTSAHILYTIGMKIFEKFNLYKYIEVYCDIFYVYSYTSENPEIKEKFEVFNKKYEAWENAGRPQGKYVRWKNTRK